MHEPGIISAAQHNYRYIYAKYLLDWYNMLLDAKSECRQKQIYQRALDCGFRKDYAYELAYHTVP